MSFWEAIRKALYLARRSRFDHELEQELRFHFETRVRELEEIGMKPFEAQSRACREFGPAARAREETRDAWRFQWLEDLVLDMRRALRSLRRSPALALTAIGCLALGIGANTLIFSLVHAILLRSLPYPDPGRLVMVRFSPPNQPNQKLGTNPGSYFFIREHNSAFEKMGALRVTSLEVGLEGGDSGMQWLQAGWCSPGLTEVMGAQPVLGRWFAQSRSDFDIVISYGLWQRMFGGARDVIGKKVRLYSGATIVGVAPPGFQTLYPDIDLWFLQPDEDLARARRSPNRVFNLFARLKPGVTLQQAQSQMDSLASPLGQEMEMNRGWSIKVDSLREVYVGHLRQPLLIFQGAVFLLLLIACANVAGLLLAQAATRQKELALRAALGSSRGRVVRQLLAENLLLSLLACAAGVGLAWAGLRILNATLPTMLPLYVHVTLNSAVLAFSFFIGVSAALIFGALPAIQVSQPDLMEILREARSTAAPGRRILRDAFVVVQVALALVLLIGAGLLTNSLLRLNLVRPGFDPHGLVTLRVPFSRSYYDGDGATAAGGLQVKFGPRFEQISEEMRQRLSRVPGVASVALAMTPPLGGDPWRFNFTRPDRPVAAAEQEAWSAEWYPVSPDYFRTLRIPLLRGREFSPADSADSRPVAVINATLAQRFFPDQDPIGHGIQTGVLYDPMREIVGIAGDVRQNRYAYAPEPQLYVPRAQLPRKMDMTLSLDVLVGSFIVRTGGDPMALAPVLRSSVTAVDRAQAITNVMTVEQYAAGQLDDLRHYAAMLSIFGSISVLLSMIGLAGIMAHAVSQRTNEIGIRVALGARSNSVLGLVARQGFALVAIGMLLGLAASLAMTRVISKYLWGVTATDPFTFVLALMAMLLVASTACFVPIRNALRIDPIKALRWE